MVSARQLLFLAVCSVLLVQVAGIREDQVKIPEFHFDWHLLEGTLLVFISGLICAGGGMGGGGLYIPIFILCLGFSPHVAIPLSKCTIVGVAIGSYLVNRRRRHPIANRPLIDYDAACVMEPMTVVGTCLGVFMNVTFPTPILIICLVVLLSVCTYRTFKKGFARRRKEQAEMQAESSRLLPGDSGAAPKSVGGTGVMPVSASGSRVTGGGIDHLGGVEGVYNADDDWAEKEEEWNSAEIQELKEEENRFPYKKVCLVLAAELTLLAFALLKGDPSHPSVVGVLCGTPVFYALVLAPLPVIVCITGYIGGMLREKYHRKENVGWVYEEGDVRWTLRNSLLFPFFSLFAGVAAGFLGIGGGLVKGPILLEMGLLPQVVSVTSAFMILFTATSTSVQFMILGRLSWQYALWYLIVGFLGAIGGNMGVAYLVKKYRQESMVAFIIGAAIGLSVVFMTLTISIREANGHGSFSFHPFCAPISAVARDVIDGLPIPGSPAPSPAALFAPSPAPLAANSTAGIM